MSHKQIDPYVHTFPAPTVLIGCGSVEKPNLITCAWFGTVCSEPPQVSVAIRPSRFSHDLIGDSGEFTVNIPRKSQLDLLKHCGSRSGRDENKIETLGLTAKPCPPLSAAPMVVEFPIVLACGVREILELGTHTLFIGEILAIHAEEADLRSGGRVNPRSTDQVVYLDGKYWSLAPID